MKIKRIYIGILAVVVAGVGAVLVPYLYVLAKNYSYVYATATITSKERAFDWQTLKWKVRIISSHYGCITGDQGVWGVMYGNQRVYDSSHFAQVACASWELSPIPLDGGSTLRTEELNPGWVEVGDWMPTYTRAYTTVNIYDEYPSTNSLGFTTNCSSTEYF